MSDRTSLILLPGLLCDKALWQHQIPALADRADIHVPDLTKHSRISDLAKQVLAEAPPRFALGALSMGGYVALEIMRVAPERVERLALIDTSARADTPEQKERREALIALSRSGKFKGVTPRLMPMLVHPDSLKDDAITDVILAMAERVGREAFERQQTAILHRIDSRSSLPAIKCPTLVVCGMQDEITPPEIARETAEGIGAAAQLKLIDKSGHLTPLERPDAVTALMRAWLQR
ncbi:MAG: alpha/beta fold hydrolase [Alphaproteobacteria bacterium]|nr:alpha/beta fold hydrolase [Alphaproteobacteria bacterium]